MTRGISLQVDGMPAKPAAREFHVMEFVHHDEAAAFVAALSRFLNSPDAPRAGKKKSPIEVWARSPVASEGVVLFLSDAAQAAADKAFSPVSIGRTVKRASLPDECFLIIEGGVTPAWGAAEASARLSQRKGE
jgi:sarcosine oxidase gamma subunit